jgi:hypothetical protein
VRHKRRERNAVAEHVDVGFESTPASAVMITGPWVRFDLITQ